MRTKMHRAFAVAVAGLLAVGCGSAETSGDKAPAPGPAAVVEVFNHNWMDINVYTIRAGVRTRLGTVGSMSQVTFRLPPAAVPGGTVRLMAAPIGSTQTLVTDGIPVQRGDRIEWKLANRLAQSSYSVRPR